MSSDRLTDSPPPNTPPEEKQLKQKRKRTTYTIMVVIVALIVSTVIENYFLETEANASIANNILVLDFLSAACFESSNSGSIDKGEV